MITCQHQKLILWYLIQGISVFIQYCILYLSHSTLLSPGEVVSTSWASPSLCPTSPYILSHALAVSLSALCRSTFSSFSHKDKDTTACVEVLHECCKTVIGILCNSQHLSECANVLLLVTWVSLRMNIKEFNGECLNAAFSHNNFFYLPIKCETCFEQCHLELSKTAI